MTLDLKITKIKSDILIIGGGMAGFFAAVAANKNGLDAIIVDKGTVGRSGFTPWANTFSIFDESLGDTENEWIKGVQTKGEYLVNLDYFAMQIEDSLPRYNDLKKWGIVDEREEWEKSSSITARQYLKGRDRRLIMPKVLKEQGTRLIERVMITDLIKNNSRICGAIGFHVENNEAYSFQAKAVVLCSGAGGYKAPGYPIHGCTFDGDALAYKSGASISGKDFMDFHFTGDKYPWDVFAMEEEVFVNRIYPTKGPKKEGVHITIDPIFKVHKDLPPLTEFFNDDEKLESDDADPRNKGKSLMPKLPDGNIVMGAATGLGVHKSEGVWPVNNECFSGVEGLYAAGDALCSMICGAAYPSTGLGLSGSAVQGHRAGIGASKYVMESYDTKIDNEFADSSINKLYLPLSSSRGFSPRWASQVLLNTMSPYYILLYMKEDRLKSALKQVEFLRDNVISRLKAYDLHELRLVYEVQNMTLNAEMKLRACLIRKESRGNHFREDFPFRNDKEFLAWILIKKGSTDKMVLSKKFVPDKWKGDTSESYKTRYPLRFPGEDEILKTKGLE